MSVRIQSLVWEHAPYAAGTLLVLLALADWSNDEGESWPSMLTLARKARMSERNAQTCVGQIKRDGFLVVKRGGGRTGDGRGISNRYLINVEALRALPTVKAGKIREVRQRTVRTKARVKNLHPSDTTKGDKDDTPRVTFETKKGDKDDIYTVTPTAPDPSVDPSVVDPSLDPLGEKLPSSPVKPKLAGRALTVPLNLFRSITGHMPPEIMRQEVAARLGPNPDAKKMSDCYREWLRRGYRAMAMGWLDWYETKIPAKGAITNGRFQVTEGTGADDGRARLRKARNE